MYLSPLVMSTFVVLSRYNLSDILGLGTSLLRAFTFHLLSFVFEFSKCKVNYAECDGLDF